MEAFKSPIHPVAVGLVLVVVVGAVTIANCNVWFDGKMAVKLQFAVPTRRYFSCRPPRIERYGAKFMTLGVCGGRKGGLGGANISLGVPGTFLVEPDDLTRVGGEKMLGFIPDPV